MFATYCRRTRPFADGQPTAQHFRKRPFGFSASAHTPHASYLRNCGLLAGDLRLCILAAARANVESYIGIDFRRAVHTGWKLVANNGTFAPTMTDMGASFGIATGGVLTQFTAAQPNGSSVWALVVDEVSGAVFEKEITANLPAKT